MVIVIKLAYYLISSEMIGQEFNKDSEWMREGRRQWLINRSLAGNLINIVFLNQKNYPYFKLIRGYMRVNYYFKTGSVFLNT